MFLARLYKDTNSSNTTKYITPICTYLYIIINALNETEDVYSPWLNPTSRLGEFMMFNATFNNISVISVIIPIL